MRILLVLCAALAGCGTGHCEDFPYPWCRDVRQVGSKPANWNRFPKCTVTRKGVRQCVI